MTDRRLLFLRAHILDAARVIHGGKLKFPLAGIVSPGFYGLPIELHGHRRAWGCHASHGHWLLLLQNHVIAEDWCDAEGSVRLGPSWKGHGCRDDQEPMEIHCGSTPFFCSVSRI